MNEYVILTDVCCDLPADLANEIGVVALPMGFSVDGGNYMHSLEADELSMDAFYAKMRDKKDTKTSAVNYEQFLTHAEPYLQKGVDVLYLAFSSGLSSTYQTGVTAFEELREKYPERKLLIVDTLAASLGEGMLVYLCAKKKNQGAPIEEVAAYCESIKLNQCHWFTVDDLMFLKRGGRVSAATAIVGTLLNIKPVLHVDNEGHLINVSTARGRKASIRALIAEMEKRGTDLAGQHVFISHGDCLDDAKYLEAQIREKFGVQDVTIGMIGPVVGAHAGPGTLALFFLGNER